MDVIVESAEDRPAVAVAAVTPAQPAERTLTQFDLGLIWFGAAISIGEIWAGGLPALTALGLGAGIIAIILGRIVGNGLMGLMARIGAQTGLPTMVLTRPAFGIRGSYIPAFANVLQLVGWTGWMVFIAAQYVETLAKALGLPWSHALWSGTAILAGVLCTIWALFFAGKTWWKWIERGSFIALFLLTVGMSAIVLGRVGIANLPAGHGSGLGLLTGMDLVIAMSVSWLPVVADYSRFAKSGRRGGAGTFWGYLIAGTWSYSVGLLIALATGTDAPDQMVVKIMSTQGPAWVILAIALILLSTVMVTFLDIYSAAVSAQNLWPRVHEKQGTILCGVIGTAFGLYLFNRADTYQPFLLAISAIFLPAFVVVLADHFFLARRMVQIGDLDRPGGRYWYSRGYNWAALLAWLAGFLVFDWAQGFPSLLTLYGGLVGLSAAVGGHLPTVNPAIAPFAYGASLPCIVVTAAMYLLLSSFSRK